MAKDSKHVVWVEFTIAQGRMAEFLPLMRTNAAASVRDEPGCEQFDVLVTAEHPDTIFLYEIYTSPADFAAHLESAHFKSFAAATSSMIQSRRVLRMAPA